MMYSTMAYACNRILVGKTFWKFVAMPSLLFASEVVEYNKTEIQTLEEIDDIFRTILEVPDYDILQTVH